MKSDFIDLITILTKSSARVLWCPTKETYRAAETLREHANHNSMVYKEWDCIHGWREFKPNAEPPKTGDGATDFFMGLQSIDDVGGGYQKGWKEGVFVMHYPHWMLGKSGVHFGIVQLLKQYARSFASTKQRLIMLTPAGFVPPVELIDEIATCELALPSHSELRELLTSLVDSTGKMSMVSWMQHEESVTSIVNAGSGLTEPEFRLACGRAMVQNKATWPNTPLSDFLGIVMEAKTEAVKRSEVLSVLKSGDINQIGGLENLKTYLKRCAGWRSKKAKDRKIRTPKGISLIGPPGTGKTLTAMAAGAVLGLPIIRLDIGACFNSLIGESESRLRDALRMIKAMMPCIVFVDEVDKALGGAHQAAGDGGVTKRILGYLLEFMQNEEGAFFMFTANRTEGLDSALLRKGRLDEVFSVMPPNKHERMEIFKIHLKSRGHDPAKVPNLASAVANSDGFIAAELEAAVESASRDCFDDDTAMDGNGIVAALKDIKPIKIAFKEDFDKMVEWASRNARPASAPDAEVKPVEAKPVRGRARATINMDEE